MFDAAEGTFDHPALGEARVDVETPTNKTSSVEIGLVADLVEMFTAPKHVSMMLGLAAYPSTVPANSRAWNPVPRAVQVSFQEGLTPSSLILTTAALEGELGADVALRKLERTVLAVAGLSFTSTSKLRLESSTALSTALGAALDSSLRMNIFANVGLTLISSMGFAGPRQTGTNAVAALAVRLAESLRTEWVRREPAWYVDLANPEESLYKDVPHE